MGSWGSSAEGGVSSHEVVYCCPNHESRRAPWDGGFELQLYTPITCLIAPFALALLSILSCCPYPLFHDTEERRQRKDQKGLRLATFARGTSQRVQAGQASQGPETSTRALQLEWS